MRGFVFILFFIFAQIGLSQNPLTQDQATDLLLSVPEIESILTAHKNDTTVTNKLIQESTESNEGYYNYRLAKFFSYSEHTTTLWHLRVDINTKEIEVMDIIEGDYISLEKWKKEHYNSKKTEWVEDEPIIPTLLIYGLPRSNKYNNARSLIADKWNIQFLSVGGCIVSESLQDSVKANNLLVNQQIEDIHGKDWKDRFYGEVEEEEKRVTKAYDLLEEQSFIKDLKKGNKWVDFMFNDKLSEGVYTVVVLSHCDWEGKSKICAFYELEVDIALAKVEIVHNEKIIMEFE